MRVHVADLGCLLHIVVIGAFGIARLDFNCLSTDFDFMSFSKLALPSANDRLV